MCGITGFIHLNRTLADGDLKRMVDTIRYRGPDDEGIFLQNKEKKQVGFAHKRLAILDLTTLGHQPMSFENLVMVHNGEVYNFLEIRDELENIGYEFQSRSDTEVILKAFHQWGIDCVNRFNGMFAIAIYDKIEETLYLIRDRMGIKPLYYFYDGTNMVFASELKPIMAYPWFEKKLNLHALNMYLFHGYITAPHSIFENVFKLEPGHVLIFKNDRMKTSPYWSIEEKFTSRKIQHKLSEQQAAEQLDELLTSAVRYRLISDVPVGSFLSGGYDSAIITAIMQKISNHSAKTFCIGFNEQKYNEAPFAREVAKHLKTDHQEIYLPVDEVKSLIPDIPKYYDEPFADSSQLPTMIVSELAKEQVKVALSGDGGDELFAGYNQYDFLSKYRPYKPLGILLRSLKPLFPIERLLNAINPKLVKLPYLNSDHNIINFPYLYSRFYLNGVVGKSSYEYENKYMDVLELSDNHQEGHMLKDMITYLPDDILTKVDRASMSVSLESRVPLLDHRLVEWSFTLPHQFKYRKREKKYIIKSLASRYLPEYLLSRPKHGFAIPTYEWLHGDLHFLVEQYLSTPFIKEQTVFNQNRVDYLIQCFEKKRHVGYFDRLLWHLIVFQMWYEEYMLK